MHSFPDDIRVRFERLWHLLARPSELEADPAFHASLTKVMREGFRWGSVAIMIGVVAHVAIAVFGKGESVVWMYSTQGGEVVAVAYHVLVFAVGAGLWGLSVGESSLETGRWLGALGAVVACGASLHDDLLHGGYVSLDFITMIYMVAVVMVPFRPGQALLTGGGILALFALFVGPGVLLPEDITIKVERADAAAGIGMTVLLGTAVSTVLYATRHTQHRIRRDAQERLREAKEQAEDALETVEAQAEQLQEIDEMKSRFFANVSHELRTPLSLMLGPIQQMLDESERDEDEREILDIVHRNAERLQRLVEQLLNLARYDAGHLSLDPQRQVWGRFVERVVQRFTPLAEAQSVALSTATEGAERAVVFDPDRMETVLGNLVRNALTYTPGGGTVEVQATVEGDTAVLSVVDDGPGISVEEQEVLFDRFYRGAQVERGGMGIGLALTQALVALHDGTIEVDSAAEEGSRFTVQWPASRFAGEDRSAEVPSPIVDGPLASASGDGRASSEGGREQRIEPEEESPHLVDRTTVLVVDDNADVRRYVRSLLEPRYRVLEAENGDAGVKQARAKRPDLVVADVMMPEMDGFSMLTHLRQSDRTAHIPVVMLTARAEEEAQVEGLREGAEAYVTKPFGADVLVAQVDRLISSRQQLRERHRGGDGEPETTAEDQSFEGRVRSVAQAHLTDADFTVEDLAEEVGRTRRTVTRRVKETFGMSPSALIRTLRLEQGAKMLDEGAGTVSEIAYAVGFNSLSYFSRRFKEHFGVSPSDYRAD
jgi:signal transduction histidine kinase/DNA-binding response OmpR family regulator